MRRSQNLKKISHMFDVYSVASTQMGDFLNFCGLFRKPELQPNHKIIFIKDLIPVADWDNHRIVFGFTIKSFCFQSIKNSCSGPKSRHVCKFSAIFSNFPFICENRDEIQIVSFSTFLQRVHRMFLRILNLRNLIFSMKFDVCFHLF